MKSGGQLFFGVLFTGLLSLQAAEAKISRATPGYTYFARPGATLADHDIDLQACASIADSLLAQEAGPSRGATNLGLVGNLVGGWIAGRAQNGVVAAGLENCMIVRGWRTVVLSQPVAAAWLAMTRDKLRETISSQVGASTPTGQVVRQWNNDAARGTSSRFELRPPLGGVQLALRTLLDPPLPPQASSQAAEVGRVSFRDLTRTEPADRWDAASPQRALLVVKMRGVGPSTGVTLLFNRVSDKQGQGTGRTVVLPFQHGLSGGRKEGRFYVYEVEPGTWRLGAISALSLCLGAPDFDIRPGEVVFTGSFDLSADTIGPDMELESARAFLSGHSAAAKLRPAQYRNGSTAPCTGESSIYALEVPGAPFEPGYGQGSLANSRSGR